MIMKYNLCIFNYYLYIINSNYKKNMINTLKLLVYILKFRIDNYYNSKILIHFNHYININHE
jgi:hypothetical protein